MNEEKETKSEKPKLPPKPINKSPKKTTGQSSPKPLTPDDIKAYEAAPSAPLSPSIVSAPRERRPVSAWVVLVVSLIVSVCLNVVALIFILSENATITQQASDLEDARDRIEDLKNQLNSIDNL